MKSFFTGILILVCWCNSIAQVEKGINVLIGVGSIHSGNLKGYFSKLNDESTSIVSSNAHSNFGGYVGFGGRIVYPFSGKFSFQTELNLSYQSSKIFMNQKSTDLDANNTGTTERITSEASVKLFNASIPLLIKYNFVKRYFAFTGFTFNFTPHPLLKSHEEMIISDYNFGVLSSSDVTEFNKKVTMSKFNPVNVMFTLGIEKRLKRGLRNLSVSIRGNYSLTKSQMYTNNDAFFNNSLNNRVFTNTGKSLIEIFSGTKLNDYRLGSYFITFTYHIVKKEKKESKEKK